MNLYKVKSKVKEISKSTGTKHPKTLITELCSVIESLILEIEKIQHPKMTVLDATRDKGCIGKKLQPQPPWIPTKSPREEKTGPRQPGQYPPYNPNRTNAGDAR